MLREPIFDLASGRCYLVKDMAKNVDNMIVATDFSPKVSARDRIWLEELDLYEKVSLLAVDACYVPFKDQTIGILTTNLGLPNIKDPANLLSELRHVVKDRFFAISQFYPEDDEQNTQALRESGLSSFFRAETITNFSAAGWKVDIANVCRGKAKPTPGCKLLEGASVDKFPIVETLHEWGVIVAR